MAFKKTVSYELIRKIILVLIALPLVATSNIDCGGKAFHCVNSTHFMICVDIGGGVSSTMDGFVIPCPPSTACQESNHFECEFPRTTTVLPTTETSVSSELKQSNYSVVTESAIITTTANEISEVQSTDIRLNTVSTTTITDDSLTTDRVTESVTVANSATIDFTTIAYTLETVPNEISAITYTNDITTSNPNDVRYSVTETSALIYQNTVATLVVDDVTNTNDPIMPDNISKTYKPTLQDQTATEPLTVNNMVDSFTTEIYTTIHEDLYTDVNEVVENSSFTENAFIGNEQLQITTTESIDTTVGTTTTAENIDFTNMDTLTTESYAEAQTTETQQLRDHTTSGFGPDLSEVINTENANIFENLILTEAQSSIAVAVEHTTLSEPLQSSLGTVVHPDLEFGTTESSYYIDKISTTKDYNNIIDEDMYTIAGTTYDTTNTNPITQKHNSTEVFTEDTLTNVVLENEDTVFTAFNIETTVSSIVTVHEVTTLGQDTGVFTQDESTTESNLPTPISVTVPVTSNQFTTGQTIGEYQATFPYSEPSAIIDTKLNIVSTDETIPINDTVSLNTTNTSYFNISDVTAASTASTASDTGITTADDSTSTLRSVTEGSDGIRKEYSFTEFTESVPSVGLPSMEPSILKSDIFGSVKDSTVLEFATAFPDMETESTITDTGDRISKQTTTSINVSDSRQDMLITESYKLPDTSTINSHFTNEPQTQTDVGQDQLIFTSVTNVPTKDQENKYNSGFDQKSTIILVARKVDGTIAVNTDVNINENYLEHITNKTNIIEQQLIGNVVSTATVNGSTVTEKMVRKPDTTEDIVSANNANQEEKVTMEKSQTLINADMDSQNVYNVAASVSLSGSTPDYYQSSAHESATVRPTVSIPHQKSIIGSEILQTATTGFDTSSLHPELYVNNGRIEAKDNRDIDDFNSTYISVNDTKTKHVSGTATPAIPTEIIFDTSHSRQSTLNQGFTEINIELKSDSITTKESASYNRNNEIVINLPQLSPDILSESDFNVNNYPTTHSERDIPYQLENSVLQTLPESVGNNRESNREVTLEEKHVNNGIRDLIYHTSGQSTYNLPIVTEATKNENVYYVIDRTQISTDSSAAFINNEKNIAGYDLKVSTVSDINIENEQKNKDFNKPSTSSVENKVLQHDISLSASPTATASEQNQNNTNIVKSFIDTANKGSQQEIGLSASQVADEQNQNSPSVLKTLIVTANNESQQEIGLSARQVNNRQNQNNPDIVKSSIDTANKGSQQEIVLSASQVADEQNQNNPSVLKTSIVTANNESQQEFGLSARQVNNRQNQNNPDIVKSSIDTANKGSQQEIVLSASQVADEQNQNNPSVLKTSIFTANNESQQEIGLSARQLTNRQNQNNPDIVKSSIDTANKGSQQDIGLSASQVANEQNQNNVSILKSSTGTANKDSHQEIGSSASQVVNKQNQNDPKILKPSTDSTNIDTQQEIGKITHQVVNEYNQNNTNTLVDQNIAKDDLQINNVVLFETVTINQQDSITSNVEISQTTDALESNATQQFPNSIQGLATENRKTEEITNTKAISNKTRVTLTTSRDTSVSDSVVNQQSIQNTKTSVSLLQAEPSDQQVRPNAEVGTTPTIYTIKDDDYSNQASLLTHKSNTKTEPSAATEVLFSETITKMPKSSSVKYSLIDETLSQGAVVTKTKANSQATSVPSEGSLTQSLVLEQNTEVKVTNTANKRSDTATVIKTDTISIDTKVTQIPDTSIRQPLISDDNFEQNLGSKSALPEFRTIVVSNVTEHGHLAIPKISNGKIQFETVAEEQIIISDNAKNTSGNIVVPEFITTTPRETTVIYTTQSSTNINGQKPIDPFCLTRNRGRYSDTQDCTKFYICIGKTNPIVGKCPVNTVFSETKKQCTKNKAHCVRGNEFQCISEGRFSDIMKNNAYYICIKRQNNFIRFKFQCQNGYYLNKITVRCTKHLEANQSSTSVDKSEKNVSEGTSSKEARKGKNKTDKEDKKEDKSSEEFECKKEGKFADLDNCRKFYVCSKTKKSEFRMRRKSCDSDELFHKDKKKCVDADSYEC